MLRSLKSGIVLAIALAVAPVGLSTYGLVEKNASAVATYRPGAMKPHSTRVYTAGGEMRVCNDGPVRCASSRPIRSGTRPTRCWSPVVAIRTGAT